MSSSPLLDTIRAGFKSLHPRLVAMDLAEKSSEENVRIWVIDSLIAALRIASEMAAARASR